MEIVGCNELRVQVNHAYSINVFKRNVILVINRVNIVFCKYIVNKINL